MKGTDEMLEGQAIAALRRAIGALEHAVFWAESASDHMKIQAALIKDHVEPLEGFLGAMLENRRRRRDGE